MQYFKDLTTVAEIKAAFRKLAMANHPDRGGDTETMKAINSQYQAALKGCNGETSTGTDNKEHVYRYNEEMESELAEKIAALVGLGMAEVEIMLIGTWIWIEGDTKPHKESLKGMGCKWHGRRKCWFWRKDTGYKSRQSKGSLSDLAASYGYQSFKGDERKKIS